VPGALSGSIAPPGRGYRFTRDVTAEGSLLRADYQIENLGEAPLAWSWAQHMLLAADENTKIVASSPLHLRLDSAYRDGGPSDDIGWLLPDGSPPTVLGLHDATGRAAKFWIEPPIPSVVAVVNGAERLAWRVADSSFPNLGLWVNLGGWGGRGLRQVALEPAFGASDRPEDALPRLEPLAVGARRAWHVLVEAGHR
jgi:hypothetical protein